MYLVATFALAVVSVILGAVGEVSAQDLCRCEAIFEELYDDEDRRRRHHRLLINGVYSTMADVTPGYPYDYGTAYINSQDYWVVGGVVVLPGESEVCRAASRDKYLKYWMTRFGGGRRHLAQDETLSEEEEEVESNRLPNARVLRGRERNGKGTATTTRGRNGKMSSSGAARTSITTPFESSQQYYFYGGGKGKEKVKGMVR